MYERLTAQQKKELNDDVRRIVVIHQNQICDNLIEIIREVIGIMSLDPDDRDMRAIIGRVIDHSIWGTMTWGDTMISAIEVCDFTHTLKLAMRGEHGRVKQWADQLTLDVDPDDLGPEAA